MDNDKRINDIVEMLDRLVSEGSGHINVDVLDETDEAQVNTGVSIDCGTHNMACAVPTLHKGIDDK